jgi:hypothetical protein
MNAPDRVNGIKIPADPKLDKHLDELERAVRNLRNLSEVLRLVGGGMMDSLIGEGIVYYADRLEKHQRHVENAFDAFYHARYEASHVRDAQ